MICQICRKEMPFKIRKDKYYYEIPEISMNTKKNKSEISKEMKAPHLALCPVCSAKYSVFVQHDSGIMSDICTQIRKREIPKNEEDVIVDVSLDSPQKITFDARHFAEIRAILMKETKGKPPTTTPPEQLNYPGQRR